MARKVHAIRRERFVFSDIPPSGRVHAECGLRDVEVGPPASVSCRTCLKRLTEYIEEGETGTHPRRARFDRRRAEAAIRREAARIVVECHQDEFARYVEVLSGP